MIAVPVDHVSPARGVTVIVFATLSEVQLSAAQGFGSPVTASGRASVSHTRLCGPMSVGFVDSGFQLGAARRAIRRVPPYIPVRSAARAAGAGIAKATATSERTWLIGSVAEVLLRAPERLWWALEDPRQRSYFVFWTNPGGKLVRARA